jgi:hypothetical protein
MGKSKSANSYRASMLNATIIREVELSSNIIVACPHPAFAE